MKAVIALLVAGLLLSGCTRSDVNEVSVFKYAASDNVAETTLKTLGNLLPWTFTAVIGVAAGAVVLGVMGAVAAVESSR